MRERYTMPIRERKLDSVLSPKWEKIAQEIETNVGKISANNDGNNIIFRLLRFRLLTVNPKTKTKEKLKIPLVCMKTLLAALLNLLTQEKGTNTNTYTVHCIFANTNANCWITSRKRKKKSRSNTETHRIKERTGKKIGACKTNPHDRQHTTAHWERYGEKWRENCYI